mmetsp:Transcript_19272/g.31396  ORF Transcript_19272/g.31396 Transcript_19272/m.31396 type:complete len:903 (+) Transcript_19272:222-2930(+)
MAAYVVRFKYWWQTFWKYKAQRDRTRRVNRILKVKDGGRPTRTSICQKPLELINSAYSKGISVIVGGKRRRQGGNLVGLLSLLFALWCLCMITYGGGGSFKSLLSSGIPEEFYTVTPPGHRLCWDPQQGMLGWRGMMQVDEELYVVTSATSNLAQSKLLNNFQYTMREQGYRNFLMVDVEGPFRDEDENSFWRRRIDAMRKAMLSLPPDTLVLVLDSLDVLFLKGPETLLGEYKKMNKKVVYGAEMLCDTASCRTNSSLKNFLLSRAPKPSNAAKFLNAGNVIGKAGDLATIYQKVTSMMRIMDVDDQTALVHTWYEEPDLLSLDYEMAIFAVLPPWFDLFNSIWNLRGRRLINRETGEEPAIVHFAGMRLQATEKNMYGMNNPCQMFLSSVYTQLGTKTYTMFELQQSWLVVSLTTTPDRLVHLEDTLDSLKEQTLGANKIYLNIPHFSERFHKEYKLPGFIKNDPAITVNWCKDYGPITKLIPTLEKEMDPDTLIITVDDDMVYEKTMFARLVGQMSSWPHAAYNYAGQVIDEYPNSNTVRVRSADKEVYHEKAAGVDILEAFLGVIYRRDFFDLEAIKDIPKTCWTTDDIWISAQLAMKGIPRIKLPHSKEQQAKATDADKVSPLRSDNVFGERTNDRCAKELLPIFKTMWSEKVQQQCPVAFHSVNLEESEKIFLQVRSGVPQFASVCSDPMILLEPRAPFLSQSMYMDTNTSSLLSPNNAYKVFLSSKNNNAGALCIEKTSDSFSSFNSLVKGKKMQKNSNRLLLRGKKKKKASSAACWFPEDIIHSKPTSDKKNSQFFLEFRKDGNLVVHSSTDVNHPTNPIWKVKIDRCQRQKCKLVLSNQGSLVVQTENELLWEHSFYTSSSSSSSFCSFIASLIDASSSSCFSFRSTHDVTWA